MRAAAPSRAIAAAAVDAYDSAELGAPAAAAACAKNDAGEPPPSPSEDGRCEIVSDDLRPSGETAEPRRAPSFTIEPVRWRCRTFSHGVAL